MARPEKVAAVEELTGILSQARGVFLTDFSGLTVQAMTDLRRRLREGSVAYLVAKNSLTSLAAERIGHPGLREFLVGPTGIAYTYDDPTQPAKILTDFARDRKSPRVKSGLIEGRLIHAEDVEAIAKLPPKEVLLGQVVGGIQAPLMSLVWCLSALPRKLVGTLDAIAKKRSEE